jgi:hypothetical protein
LSLVINLISNLFRERDQYERRVVELDRQGSQNELHVQTQTKEKENLLLQVNLQFLFFLNINFECLNS